MATILGKKNLSLSRRFYPGGPRLAQPSLSETVVSGYGAGVPPPTLPFPKPLFVPPSGS